MVGGLSFLTADPVLEAIDAALEAQAKLEPPRRYLGMSQIGHPCERRLYYGYTIGNPYPDAKSIRNFEDGHMGEDLMAKRLRMVPGIELDMQQHRMEDFGGKFAGHLDGRIRGLPQSSKPHVWEHKQVGEKKFKLLDDSLETWDPVYYAQAQMYMHYTGMERHYLTVALPGGRDYKSVRTHYADRKALAIRDKAKRIIEADSPPARINENPAFFICKMCPFQERCHANG